MPDTGGMSHVDTEEAVDPGGTVVQGHDAGHGSSHGHGEAGEPLGPIDLAAWLYAAGGALIGLLTAFALYLAANA